MPYFPDSNLFLLGFYFMAGLIIGSFLNVVLIRVGKGEELTGRSHCPKCGAMIHWYDNIPLLSFLFLRGRCRGCGKPISWRYPLIELSTGLLFALSAGLLFGDGELSSILQVLSWCILFSVLLLIGVYDFDHMEIPVSFLVWGIGLEITSLLAFTVLHLPGSSGDWLSSPLVQGLIGGGVTALFFYLLVWMSHERWMGMGDVWLGLLAGLAIGPRNILFLLTVSFTLGAIVALWLLFSKKKEFSQAVPFAPFLCLATLLVLIVNTLAPWWLEYLLLPLG